MTESAARSSMPVQLQESFRRRAEWLEREAHNQPRHPTRARLLVAASEVRALLGELKRARRLAHAARTLLPNEPLVERQVRTLSGEEEQSSHVRSLVDEGSDTAQPRPVRAHAFYLAAELSRTQEPELARSYYREAERADPSDVRPVVQRRLDTLDKEPDAENESELDNQWPALHRAIAQLRTLRNFKSSTAASSDSLGVGLLRLSNALSDRDTASAAAQIDALRTHSGLSSVGLWLTVILGGPSSIGSPDKLGALRSLVEAGHAFAARTLASEALALGDSDALDTALEHFDADSADTIALCLLAQRPEAAGSPDSSESLASTDRALTQLTIRVEGKSTGPLSTSDEKRRYETGRSILVPGDLQQVQAESSSDNEVAILTELAMERGSILQVAKLLPILFGSRNHPAHQSDLAETHFAAGLLLQVHGHIDESLVHYRQALHSPLVGEPALRILHRHDTSTPPVALYRAVLASTRDASHRAMLLTELLFHLPTNDPEYNSVSNQAIEQDPRLPIAGRLAEQACRAREDNNGVAHWLEIQRENATSAREEDLARIREALFEASENREAAARHLSALGGSIDLGTQEWREELGPSPALDCALVRTSAARACDATSRELLAAEAACWHERHDNYEAAAEAVDGALTAVGQGLWDAYSEQDNARELTASLMRRLEEAQTPNEKRIPLSRLARMEARNSTFTMAESSWLEQLYAEGDRRTSTLRGMEQRHLGAGEEGTFVSTSVELGRALSPKDRLTYAYVVSRLQTDAGNWAANRNLLDWLSLSENLPHWGLRLFDAHLDDLAQQKQDTVLTSLLAQMAQPLDRAVGLLRMAERADTRGDIEEAIALTNHSLRIFPRSVVALHYLTDLLRKDSAHSLLAEQLVALSRQSGSQEHKAQYLFEAATIWLDTLGDEPRGVDALKQASQADPSLEIARKRLSDLLLRNRLPDELQSLAEQQLEQRLSETSRLEWQIIQAEAQVRLGQFDEAMGSLDDILRAVPDNSQALNLQAAVSHAQGNPDRAQELWRRCLKANPAQADVLVALRGLVSPGMPIAPANKQAIYEELLELDPRDQASRMQLIRLVEEGDDPSRLVDLHTQLVQHAQSDSERVEYTLALVKLHTQDPTGEESAKKVLQQARRTWPEDAQILRAEVEHYQALDQFDAVRVILERFIGSTRDAIGAGRIEPNLLKNLELAFRIGGDAHSANLAKASLSAVRGQSVQSKGLGAECGSHDLDPFTAPHIWSPPLRDLWARAGEAVEMAYSQPVADATPLASEHTDQVRAIARGFGIENLRVLKAETLGCDCMAFRCPEPTLVFGQGLLKYESVQVRDFLLLRALKQLQLRGCALSRMKPEESWCVIAGLLACFVDVGKVNGDDALRLLAARDRIRPHLKLPLDPALMAQMPLLSARLLPLAMSVGDAMTRMAGRAALLGIGSVTPALTSLWAVRHGIRPTPSNQEARSQWIASDDLANDIVTFSVSDAYFSALRGKVGQ